MTVEELLEIEEIKRLRIMYSHYIDGCDIDNLTGLFCEDAVCEFGEAYGGDWVGRETIRATGRRGRRSDPRSRQSPAAGPTAPAAIIPLTATAGTPIPGMVESPTHSSPGSGVWGPGKTCP